MTAETGTDLHKLKSGLHERFFNILDEARVHSADVLKRAGEVCQTFMADEGVDPAQVAIVAVGSVGRYEALRASDLDLIPIFREGSPLSAEQSGALRTRIREELEIDVSKGEDLTKQCTIEELVALKSIGGDQDETNALTRRVLVLTESSQIAGELPLREIRNAVLNAYAQYESTSGRHVLSLSNDLARYYRTLCIEYKAKIDTNSKPWGTRNAKLRHSRKFWYFSTMAATVASAIRADHGQPLENLLNYFACPPVPRLVGAVEALGRAALPAVHDAIESYAWFLYFMSEPENRKALEGVVHEERYAPNLGNPFPALKFNSDVLHDHLVAVLDSLPRSARDRMLRWFFL